MLKTRHLVLVLLMTWCASAARADGILVGAPNLIDPASKLNYGVNQEFQSLAQQFTLNQTVQVSSVELGLNVPQQSIQNHPGLQEFDLYLLSGLSSSATQFWTTTVDTTSALSAPLSFGTSLSLGPGTYYLVAVAGNANSFGGWWQSDGTMVAPAGSVDSGSYNTDAGQGTGSGLDGTWYYSPSGQPGPVAGYTTGPLQFELIGSVPEPSSLLLFGTGLAGVAGVIRRRQRQ